MSEVTISKLEVCRMTREEVEQEIRLQRRYMEIDREYRECYRQNIERLEAALERMAKAN